MANSKISGLTSASTPLAGTETLPIVQSGATVKVPTNDLTVRNIRAAATTGILQVSGPTAGTTRTATVPDANWTAARTDAAQSFTGDQTLSTGNLVVSNGKGIDFSATPGTGTSELLADYEEGTWTPILTPGAGSITSYSSSGYYVKIGKVVCLNFTAYVSNNGTGIAYILISGLPFAAAQNDINAGCGREYTLTGNQMQMYIISTGILMQKYDGTYPGTSGSSYACSIAYLSN